MGNPSKIDMNKYSTLNINSAKATKYKNEIKSLKDYVHNDYEEIDYSKNVDKYNELAEDFINITGDINGDGKVTVKDKSLLENYMNDGTVSNGC